MRVMYLSIERIVSFAANLRIYYPRMFIACLSNEET